MTARRWALLALGLACVGVGALLAALAHDVRAWPSTLQQGDLQLRIAPGRRETWQAGTWLPSAASERAVGVREDLRFRRALRYFLLTRTRYRARFEADFNPPIEAARRSMRDVKESDLDPRLRSDAANFLGVLAFEGNRFGDNAGRADALRQFRDAIRLDPTNEQPKFNLELLLDPRTQPDSEGGGSGGGEALDAEGAGAADPGQGY